MWKQTAKRPADSAEGKTSFDYTACFKWHRISLYYNGWNKALPMCVHEGKKGGDMILPGLSIRMLFYIFF